MRYKLVCFLLAFILAVLSGCATYPPYRPQMAEAPKGETDRATWLFYYRQQFEAYGEAALPPKDDAPDVARGAYMQVHTEWKDAQARMAFVAMIGGLAFGAAIAYAIVEVAGKK